MKIASLKEGRNGRLVIVNTDLTSYIPATGIAETLQDALDDWQNIAPQLKTLSDKLNAGELKEAQDFKEDVCASPLPRAYQIADGSAYLHHVELVRKARGAEMPPEFLHDPLMYQAVSDTILPPTAPIPVADESYGIDYEAEVAIITDDVPMGVTAQDALAHIKLIMLMNDVSLRNLIPNELGKGFGFFNAKPPSAFSPVAVTPEELGPHWQNGKLHLPLRSYINGTELGHPDAGQDMQFDFGALIAHAAKTRPLGAGTIIGSGTISNYDPESGVSCLAETRMLEKIESGAFQTPFLSFGDIVKIEMRDPQGRSIFGTIEQEIIRYEAPAAQENLHKQAASS